MITLSLDPGVSRKNKDGGREESLLKSLMGCMSSPENPSPAGSATVSDSLILGISLHRPLSLGHQCIGEVSAKHNFTLPAASEI